MGHSASIAKKYNVPQIDEEASEHDSLATVSSYRPTSPLAHSDAQQFRLRSQSEVPRDRTNSQYSYRGMNGTIPSRSSGYRHHINASSSTLGTQPLRSMREVHHFLVENPELLSGKSGHKKSQFHNIETPKQIKTKQNVYLGLLDPPTVYGKGVNPDKQLKVNQRMYLQLIHPTIAAQQYYTPSLRSYKPTGSQEMVVMRKEDAIKKKLPERSRPPLKTIEGQRSSPAQTLSLERQRPHSRQQVFRETPPSRSSSPRKSPRIPNGHTLPSSTPVREAQAPARRRNEYVEVYDPDIKHPGSKTKKSSKSLPMIARNSMEVDRRFDGFGTENSKLKEEEVVFPYNVEELGLLKRKNKDSASQVQPKDRSANVMPLYFRKSLAYNPKYSNNAGNILSDPL